MLSKIKASNSKRNHYGYSICCVGIAVLVFAHPSTRSSFLALSVSSPKRSTHYSNSTDCRLSMYESDNFFCESDFDWKERKLIYQRQNKRNRRTLSRSFFFQENWEPTVHCSHEQRLGNSGDGGKWICDVHRLGDPITQRILVYSVGSNGDFSFEKALVEQYPKAEIHTFDITAYKCPVNVCTFHQYRLGDGKTENSMSFPMIVKALGHEGRKIDILKIDIEGYEYNFFSTFFASAKINRSFFPYIRQILVEIHLGADSSDKPCRRAHKLFELFRANNYAIFHKEVNLYEPFNVFEYAFIRLNPAFFIQSS